jgi:hypothetical protein
MQSVRILLLLVVVEEEEEGEGEGEGEVVVLDVVCIVVKRIMEAEVDLGNKKLSLQCSSTLLQLQPQLRSRHHHHSSNNSSRKIVR